MFQYSWYDSLIECMKLNMTMATIEADTEQLALETLLKDSNAFQALPELWLGGLMIPNTRHFVWITTGKPFKYTNWFQRNPDFKYHCVLLGWGTDNEWTDINCTRTFGYICEYPRQQIVTEMVKLKLQEDIENLNENLQIEIQERDNLQQELKKQKELAQYLQEKLQQINDTKLEKQEIKVNLQQELQEPPQNLGQELPNGEQNLQQVSQNQQDSQHLTEQKLQHHKKYETKLQNDEKNKSYLSLLFSNVQNAYFFQNSH